MASFHLCSGVVCVALLSHYVLGESLARSQMTGLALLAVAMVLVLRKP